MNKPNSSSDDQRFASAISVDRLTRNVIDRLESQMHRKAIRIEKDLQQIDDYVDADILDDGIAQLIESVVSATPDGGEVHVTLVESTASWELEVAASASVRFEKRGNCSSLENEAERWPSSNPKLAQTAAQMHGGQLCAVNCPLGGVAKVLKIPRQA